MATAQQVAAYKRLTDDLVLLAVRDLEAFFASLNTQDNPIRVRDALLEFMPLLIQTYGDTAAVLAADFYDELRNAPASAARFSAVLAQTPVAAQVEASVRWGLGDLFRPDPDPVTTLENLSGSLQRLVLQSGRSTLINSAVRDPARSGFARMPQGPTCKFCTMLASRGFVYASAESAGAFNDWHDKCDCIVIPAQSKRDLPETFNLDEYRRLYAEGAGIGRPD